MLRFHSCLVYLFRNSVTNVLIWSLPVIQINDFQKIKFLLQKIKSVWVAHCGSQER